MEKKKREKMELLKLSISNADKSFIMDAKERERENEDIDEGTCAVIGDIVLLSMK